MELSAALSAADGAITVVVGPRGIGKTTLLATWLARATDGSGDGDKPVHSVFVSAEAPSSVTRALRQLNPDPAWPHPGGASPRSWWREPKAAPPRIMLIDGLRARDGLAGSLDWLPRRTERGLRLVVTATSGGGRDTDEKLAAWRRSARCRLVHVRGIDDPAVRAQLVRDTLGARALELPEEALDIIVRQPGAANPLFAIVVAAELARLGRAWWSRARLSAHFGSTAESAVSAALGAVEVEFGPVARWALRLLAVTRGAAPPELLGTDPRSVNAVLERAGTLVRRLERGEWAWRDTAIRSAARDRISAGELRRAHAELSRRCTELGPGHGYASQHANHHDLACGRYGVVAARLGDLASLLRRIDRWGEEAILDVSDELEQVARVAPEPVRAIRDLWGATWPALLAAGPAWPAPWILAQASHERVDRSLRPAADAWLAEAPADCSALLPTGSVPLVSQPGEDGRAATVRLADRGSTADLLIVHGLSVVVADAKRPWIRTESRAQRPVAHGLAAGQRARWSHDRRRHLQIVPLVRPVGPVLFPAFDASVPPVFVADGTLLVDAQGHLRWFPVRGHYLLGGVHLQGHRAKVLRVAVHPNGRRAASIDTTGLAIVWGLPDGRPISRSQVPHARGTALRISPDERWLIGWGTRTRVYELGTGRPLHDFSSDALKWGMGHARCRWAFPSADRLRQIERCASEPGAWTIALRDLERGNTLDRIESAAPRIEGGDGWTPAVLVDDGRHALGTLPGALGTELGLVDLDGRRLVARYAPGCLIRGLATTRRWAALLLPRAVTVLRLLPPRPKACLASCEIGGARRAGWHPSRSLLAVETDGGCAWVLEWHSVAGFLEPVHQGPAAEVRWPARGRTSPDGRFVAEVGDGQVRVRRAPAEGC